MKNPASAVFTPGTVPNAMDRARRATVAIKLTESEAAKAGILDRWRQAMNRQQARLAKKAAVRQRLNDLVTRLQIIAEKQEWSQRQLAAKLAIPKTTFHRICGGKVEPSRWMPVLEAALTRLN